MNIELRVSATDSRTCAEVEGADHVVAEGRCPNPLCGGGGPFRVSGKIAKEVNDREVHAPAWCRACGADVGTLVVGGGLTVFGFVEDDRVLNGPWKVY